MRRKHPSTKYYLYLVKEKGKVSTYLSLNYLSIHISMHSSSFHIHFYCVVAKNTQISPLWNLLLVIYIEQVCEVCVSGVT